MAFYSDTFLLHITARFIGFRLLLEDLKKTEAIEVGWRRCVGDITQFAPLRSSGAHRHQPSTPVLSQPPSAEGVLAWLRSRGMM